MRGPIAKTAPVAVAAVDLGASSGRVMVGRVLAGRSGAGLLELHEALRFPNVPVTVLQTQHWDILRLFQGVLDGVRAAAASFDLASMGIDSWGVDYGLIDEGGALLGNPVHYRDARTEGMVAEVLAKIPPQELYATTGVPQLPINTIYQLAAAARTPQLRAARTLLLIPDLLGYWLTGEVGAEMTNASTTQLFDVRTRSWATQVMERAGIPARLFPVLRQPGSPVGDLLPDVASRPGLASLRAPFPVIAVASHDTASAVVSVPAQNPQFAYISCGTWSLVGVELDQPVLTDASRIANFTNEAGVDGTIRYLRNVMGLWLLQESVRTWSDTGLPADLETLLSAAAQVPRLRAVIDPDDPVFLPPGDIPARIVQACRRTGQSPPENPAETVRCILDSLALAFRRAILQVQELSGRQVETVHIVGGGTRSALLCQLTADACGMPVVAGPTEAAALGNILIQARTLGAVPADLDGIRALVRATQRLRRFDPAGSDARGWDAAARRLGGLRP